METGTQIIEHQGDRVVTVEETAMSPGLVKNQVQVIQRVMNDVMKEGTHYGIIPGTDKPTLLKAGAEKLLLTFRFSPDYSIIREIAKETFIAYTIKCTLIHQTSGIVIATGIGSCNSKENKYRWRHSKVSTGKPVPKAYWDNNRDQKLIGGHGFGTIKIDGMWFISENKKIENDNPWELDNTLIKMAQKRALVAAILNGTAASDIFTQDLEDMNLDEQAHGGKPSKHQKPSKAQQRQKEASPWAEKREEAETSSEGWDAPTKAYSKMLHSLTSHEELSELAREFFGKGSWSEMSKPEMEKVKRYLDDQAKNV